MSAWLRRMALILALMAAASACSGPRSAGGPRPTSTPLASATATAAPTPSPTPTTAPPVATATSAPTAAPTQAPPPPTPTATTPVPEPTAPPTTGVITLTRAQTSEKIIALTFDAGADRGFAGQILDTLKAEGIKATFGMTGVWAEDNPDLIKRMVAEGHQLMNHTYDHQSFTGNSTGAAPLTTAQRLDEIRHTEQVVSSIAGYDLRPYFRPPYGDYDQSVLRDIAEAGYTVNVMWTVDCLGWNGLSAAQIIERCVHAAKPGAVLLMHVGSQSQEASALPELIHQLRAQGYRFVTVREMVGR